MAYQNPAFYFYNHLRATLDASTSPTNQGDLFALYDSRLGELFAFDTDLAASTKHIIADLNQTAESNAIDTLIISGANCPGNEMRVLSYPVTFGVDVVARGPELVVPTPVPEPIVYELDSDFGTDDVLSLRVRTGSGSGAVFLEYSEVMFTTKRELTRGPNPGWDHPWQRTQNRFESPGGVTSTWQTGPARKRYTLTWSHLFGADRQIFLDMREQTNDWADPFWFLPPDDIYPIVFMELDRDSQWTQDHGNPLDSGTSDEVTLPLIEVLG